MRTASVVPLPAALVWLLVATAALAQQAPKQSPATLLSQANKAAKAERYSEAETLYREVLKVVPGSEPARRGLGIALIHSLSTDLDKVQEGVHLLEGLKDSQHRDADFWLALGLGYSQLGNRPQAAQAYQRFLQLEPTGKRAMDVRFILEPVEVKKAEKKEPSPRPPVPFCLTLVLRPEGIVIASPIDFFTAEEAELKKQLRLLREEFPEERALAITVGKVVAPRRLARVLDTAWRAGFGRFRPVPVEPFVHASRAGAPREELTGLVRQHCEAHLAQGPGATYPELMDESQLCSELPVAQESKPPRPSGQEVLDGIALCAAVANSPWEAQAGLMVSECARIPSCALECAKPLAAWSDTGSIEGLAACAGFDLAAARETGETGEPYLRCWLKRRVGRFVQTAKSNPLFGSALEKDCRPVLFGTGS